MRGEITFKKVITLSGFGGACLQLLGPISGGLDNVLAAIPNNR